MNRVPVIERFWSKVVISDDCWEWAGSRNQDGYGNFRGENRSPLRAHRFSYTHFVGPIPDDLVIDHLCRNRACVNPDHLELVSRRTNTLRGEGPAAQRARATHCIHGHEFTEANTFRDRDGHRNCRQCHTERTRRRRAAARLAADSGGIDGGFLLAFAVILAVVLVYVAAGGAR